TRIADLEIALTLDSGHRAFGGLLTEVVENALFEVNHIAVAIADLYATVGVRRHPFTVRPVSAEDGKPRQAFDDSGTIQPERALLISEKLRVHIFGIRLMRQATTHQVESFVRHARFHLRSEIPRAPVPRSGFRDATPYRTVASHPEKIA